MIETRRLKMLCFFKLCAVMKNYFRKPDNFFFGKQQGAIRTDQEVYSLIIYNFCMVVRIFKVATLLPIFSTTLWYNRENKRKVTINFDNT